MRKSNCVVAAARVAVLAENNQSEALVTVEDIYVGSASRTRLQPHAIVVSCALQ
jgi:hypothetical protein